MKKITATALSLLLLLSAILTSAALTPHGNGLKIRNWVVNDPDYKFSSQYKTSVWYQNFTALELSDNERNNVLRVAISQLGYHEGNCSDDFDGMNKDGTDNYVEYARLFYPNYNNNHFEWCACFVNWCLNQSRISHTYGEMSCKKWIEWLDSQELYQDSQGHGGSYKPKPADMIFFQWDGDNTRASHIGLVLYITETTVYTIEGNSDDQVSLKHYDLKDKRVIGYGTPNYNEGTEGTMDLSPTDEFISGHYILLDEELKIHKEMLNSSTVTGNIEFGRMIFCHEQIGEWTCVTANGINGYIKDAELFMLKPYAPSSSEPTTKAIDHTTVEEPISTTSPLGTTETRTEIITEPNGEESTSFAATTMTVVTDTDIDSEIGTSAHNSSNMSTDVYTNDGVASETSNEDTEKGCSSSLISVPALLMIAVGAFVSHKNYRKIKG